MDHSTAVGGEVLVRCNKCELDLWHTVIAKVAGVIKRVRCNTCKTEHSMRGSAARTPAPHKRAAKPTQTQVVRVQNRVPHKPWKELIAGREQDPAPDYSVKAELGKNTLVRHPSFGLGIVTELSEDRKRATVLFESGEKVLAANR